MEEDLKDEVPECLCLYEVENNLPKTKSCFVPCIAHKKIMDVRTKFKSDLAKLQLEANRTDDELMVLAENNGDKFLSLTIEREFCKLVLEDLINFYK